jgi:hypothetical protein
VKTAFKISAAIVAAAAAWAASPEDSVYLAEILYAPTSATAPAFVEFYNAAPENVSLAGWRVKISGKNGMEQATLPDTAVIPARGFYLVGRDGDRQAWNGQPYKPDFYCDLSMSFRDGGGGAMLMTDASETRDAIGWGTANAPFFEGTPFPPVSTGRSIERKSGPTHSEIHGNSYDTGDNSDNCRERAVPQPQNINSPREYPSANTEENAWGRIKAMYYYQ